MPAAAIRHTGGEKGARFRLEWLIVAIVSLGTSFVKTAFGLGAGVLFGPVLALFLEPRQAMGMTAPVMLLSSVAALTAHWRRWDWPVLRRLLPTALAGLWVGSLFLARAPAPHLRRAIGAVALAFAAVQLARLRRGGPVPSAGDRATGPALLLGFSGGVVSGIANSGGLFFSMYLLPRLEKVAFVASLTATLMVVDLFRLVSYWYLDVLQPRHVLLGLLCAPLMLVGGWLGKRLNGRLSPRAFVGALSALIAATGLALLAR